jgi:aldehyde dehydrogenase (NAD+)
MAIQDVDAAIEYVNARPTPLALYVFSEKRKDFEYGPLLSSHSCQPDHEMLTNLSIIVIERTLSGGACWNDVSIQTVQRGLPFGGVGESGCECSGLSGSLAGLIVVVIGGSGHGKNAYETFTHRRGMFWRISLRQLVVDSTRLRFV